MICTGYSRAYGLIYQKKWNQAATHFSQLSWTCEHWSLWKLHYDHEVLVWYMNWACENRSATSSWSPLTNPTAFGESTILATLANALRRLPVVLSLSLMSSLAFLPAFNTGEISNISQRITFNLRSSDFRCFYGDVFRHTVQWVHHAALGGFGLIISPVVLTASTHHHNVFRLRTVLLRSVLTCLQTIHCTVHVHCSNETETVDHTQVNDLTSKSPPSLHPSIQKLPLPVSHSVLA